MKKIKPNVTALIILILAVWQITPAGMAASSHSPQILPEVTSALQESDTVRVIIELNAPDISNMSFSEQAEQVKLLQDAVLSGLSEPDFKLKRRFQTIPALAGEVTAAGLKALETNATVASISLDVPVSAHDSAALSGLQANTVHAAYGVTGQGVTVAVLDTGIDIDHPDFSGRIIAQHCFTNGDCQDYAGDISLADESGYADDLNGHGTNVAGIIGSNGIAYAETKGFAPAANLVALRVLDHNGSGWTSDWEAGLEWLYNTRGSTSLDIVNMSLGTDILYSGNCDSTWNYAASLFSAMNSAGVTIFASTGNKGSSSSISAPACNSNVIGVGATSDGNLGARTWFGCYDSSTSLNKITCFTNSNAMMDMVAPGAYITSSGNDGGASTYYGTSQASPTAAGVAALMLEVNPTLTLAQIESAMKATGVAVVDAKNGLTFKRINALKAVQSQTTISIDGNHIGLIGLPSTFTAVVDPFASSVPITYTWQVDGFAPYTSTDPDVNTTAYNFSTSGNKVINLTVTNGGGTFADSHTIYIFASLPYKFYLPVITKK